MCASYLDRNNITKKQHYIPQVFLRGFSEDKKYIWSYLIDSMEKGKYVPIESLCREIIFMK